MARKDSQDIAAEETAQGELNVSATDIFNGMEADDETTGAASAELFDFDSVNENSYGEVWSPGVYPARIEDAVYSRSQASDNPMITCTYVVSDPETGKTRKLWDRLVFTEAALPRVKRTLQRIAPELIAPGRKFDPRVDGTELIGINCQVKVRSKPYEGQMRNEIQEVLPASEANSMSVFGN